MQKIKFKILETLVGLGLLLRAALGLKFETVKRLLALDTLFSPKKMVHNFTHMDEILVTTPLNVAPDNASPLPANPQEMPDMSGWVTARGITALVVLKDGALAHESYYRGTTDTDLRLSWSVSKSFVSALIGILLAEGEIDSVDDPVVKYAPALKGSAYERASIRNVLNMASGVDFNETYLDFFADINRMGRVLASGGSLDAFTAGLKNTAGTPGTAWLYASMDTHVLGMVICAATGRDMADLLVEKLLNPIGAEADGYLITDSHGNPFMLGGLNLRSRDYARFGLLYAQNGFMNGRQIVPADWVAQSTSDSSPQTPPEFGYGLHWWLPANARKGEFLARGVHGQFIYVNQPQRVVIAVSSADDIPEDDAVFAENIAMFRRISDGL